MARLVYAFTENSSLRVNNYYYTCLFYARIIHPLFCTNRQFTIIEWTICMSINRYTKNKWVSFQGNQDVHVQSYVGHCYECSVLCLNSFSKFTTIDAEILREFSKNMLARRAKLLFFWLKNLKANIESLIILVQLLNSMLQFLKASKADVFFALIDQKFIQFFDSFCLFKYLCDYIQHGWNKKSQSSGLLLKPIKTIKTNI